MTSSLLFRVEISKVEISTFEMFSSVNSIELDENLRLFYYNIINLKQALFFKVEKRILSVLEGIFFVFEEWFIFYL